LQVRLLVYDKLGDSNIIVLYVCL